MATETAVAKRVRVTDNTVIVELRDGRSVSVPLKWYPRLAEGRPSERRRWELIGPRIGIHWPDLDEDIPSRAFCLACCRTIAGHQQTNGAALQIAKTRGSFVIVKRIA